MTITRPHHPFHGQSLEVLRQVRMPAGLQFVLFLPDGIVGLIQKIYAFVLARMGWSQPAA